MCLLQSYPGSHSRFQTVLSSLLTALPNEGKGEKTDHIESDICSAGNIPHLPELPTLYDIAQLQLQSR